MAPALIGLMAPEAESCLLAEAVASLQRIELLLQHLPRAIAAASAAKTSSLSRHDHEALAVLLPEIVRAIGCDVLFSVPDLFAEATTNVPLRVSLEAAFGKVDQSAARRIGKLFARAVGSVHSNTCIERGGKAREGVLWRVVGAL